MNSFRRYYEETGDAGSAVEQYERTLDLAPWHRGAVARLEELRGGLGQCPAGERG